MLEHNVVSALTREDVVKYQRQGYLCPVRALDAGEPGRYLELYREYEKVIAADLAKYPPKLHRYFLTHTHTFLPWVRDLLMSTRILDAVSAILGPDLLVWGSQWFPKNPGDGSYVSWHQDAQYWDLEPANLTTAWVALTRTTEANGCLRVIPESHRTHLPHRDTFANENVLSRGQEIDVAVDEAEAVSLRLEPGEMSLHHIGIAHGSHVNRSDQARLGLAIRFVSTDVRPGPGGEGAMLVRGTDHYGHFKLIQLNPDLPSQLAQRRARAAANAK